MLIPKKPKKEEPQALAALESSTSSNSSVFVCDANIIEEKTEEVKLAKATSGKNSSIKTKNKGGLTMGHKVSDLFVKIYEEQLPNGIEGLKQSIQDIPKDELEVLAIIHNRDHVPDEIFVEAFKKLHIHFLVRSADKEQGNKRKRRKVSTILNRLGIVFRPGLDEAIWNERGVERVNDWCKSVMYLTHETEDAQRAGKEIYDRSEIMTNLDEDEVQQFREGYTTICTQQRRVSIKEQAEICDKAKTCGYLNHCSWEEFEVTLPFVLQKGSAYELIKKRFQEGVDKRMEESPEINRLCVFIEGPPNMGKTYAARHAFDGTGRSILQITDGTKTAKLDKLKESHDVLLVDDAKIPDALNMCDNRACQVYKRNSGSPYWCGDTFIVTSNDSFDDWAKYCGVNSKQLEAMRSRFYVCQIVEDENGVHYLDVISHSNRGLGPEQEARKLRFKEFRQRFDAVIAQYKPSETQVDYSDIYKRG